MKLTPLPGSSDEVDTQEPETIMGTDPSHLPNSSSHLVSAIGRELSDDSPYAKTHSQRVEEAKSRSNSVDEKV